jgi:hypothetical protein
MSARVVAARKTVLMQTLHKAQQALHKCLVMLVFCCLAQSIVLFSSALTSVLRALSALNALSNYGILTVTSCTCCVTRHNTMVEENLPCLDKSLVSSLSALPPMSLSLAPDGVPTPCFEWSM